MREGSDAGRRETGGAGDVAVRALWLLRENADGERRCIRLSEQEAAFLGLPEPWLRKAAKLPGRAASFAVTIGDFASGVDWLLRKQGAALPIEAGFLGRPAKTAGEFNAQVKALRRALRAVLDETPASSPLKMPLSGGPRSVVAAPSVHGSDATLRRDTAARRVGVHLGSASQQERVFAGPVGQRVPPLFQRTAMVPPEGAPAARKRPQPRAKARACDKRALDSLRWAQHSMANRNPTMDQVYSYIEERKCPLYNTPRWKWPGRGHRHQLSNRETWKRYVRKASEAE